MPTRLLRSTTFAACVVVMLAGCGKTTTKKTSKPESPKTAKSESEKSKTPAEKTVTEKKPDVKPTPDVSNKVMLGSPDLTAGIPGTGPLTVDEIKAWLDKPENHEALDVQLPLGMSLGKIPPEVLKDNPLTRAKIELGRQLYFDTRLSADNTVSCASCHAPDEGYARHTQFGVGIDGKQGNRNSPVAYNRILSKAQFWDGRAASLEDQAIGPIANPIEMGNTHDKAVATLKGIEGYRMQFEKIFGTDGLNIGNVGKAIAAFERAIVTGPSPYDYYEPLIPYRNIPKEDIEDDPDLKKDYETKLAASKAHPISESAIRGRDLFFGKKANCTACHVGANFEDEKYHNLGIGMDKKDPDLGRFNETKKDVDRGAFKTPTVRNVAQTAPYMHDGSLKTLEEVVEHYNKGGTPNKWLSDKIKPLKLTDQEKKDLVEFMKACTGPLPKVETGRLPK